MTGTDDTTPSGQVPDTPARAVAEALRRTGVDRVFLMTGGDIPLWQALRDAGIELVLARSEAAAVYMADGCARAAGRPAVVYGQWGPGAANVAAALADAWWARSPVVALTSSMGLSSRHRTEYQELSQLPMFDPVTKWNAEVPTAARVGELTERAVRTAAAAPARPVHLDLPRDLLTMPPGSIAWSPGPPRAPSTLPVPASDDVAAIVARLRRARRPVVLAGAGVVAGESWDELAAFADTAGVPVVTSMGGKGAISDTHPCAVGVVGRYSRTVSNQVLGEADLCLVLGSDLDGQVTDGYRLPAPGAVVVHVDLDPSVLGATLPADPAVHAAAAPALLALTAALGDSLPPEAHREWLAEVQARVRGWRAQFHARAECEAPEGTVLPETLLRDVAERLTPEDVVVTDTGYMGAWSGTLLPVARAGRTFLRAAGSLGWAFPAVLGAQLACPGGRAVAVIGDGGIGYHLGDLETAVRLGIPAVTVVLNNACLAFEQHLQERVFGNDVVPAVNDLGDVDYGAVATALGAFGARATSAKEFRDALDEALSVRRPALIDVRVPRSSAAPVTTYEAVLERAL
ncbi:thiamine pyrophosphate-binding protein [Geodermatophilus sp. SYSU D00697]